MSRLIADLQRVEARNTELAAENQLVRGILRKLATAPAMELMRRPNDVYFLDVDDCTVHLTPAEAALFGDITKETK